MNGILADEMGLGKTIQIIAALASLIEAGVPGPYLIVTPLSLLPSWADQFSAFAPRIPCLVYYGAMMERRRVDDVFWAYPIVLTSYEVAIRDAKYLQKVPFKGLVVDEGQRLKNPASRLYRRLAKFSTSLRILVTGTPLQNRISELWSLLHFILPEIFTSLEMFERTSRMNQEQLADVSRIVRTSHLFSLSDPPSFSVCTDIQFYLASAGVVVEVIGNLSLSLQERHDPIRGRMFGLVVPQTKFQTSDPPAGVRGTGSVNCYHRFIPDYATLVQPLINLFRSCTSCDADRSLDAQRAFKAVEKDCFDYNAPCRCLAQN
ncbi:lymphocyte-specific helicase [Clonorchis sinensis]|uniref:Lymphocyte-specific helicase n=1 Tax=Clonorchis sinensis TaxID=79923 RepID=G7YKF1_CLOSI|nr:lymphocyte-specific helicase [Clonorchis sinensis]